MRINVLQHTPNEGPGSIQRWSQLHHHEMYIYHPYRFGHLPSADETDMLVILGGPMSPNDDLPWIKEERKLVNQLLAEDKPIFGACYGAQLSQAHLVTKSVKRHIRKWVGHQCIYNHMLFRVYRKNLLPCIGMKKCSQFRIRRNCCLAAT